MGELDPFQLFFDSEGNALRVDDAGKPLAQNSDITDAVLNASKTAQPITDVWIFAYGWNNDVVDGTGCYNEWRANMLIAKQKLQEQKRIAAKYQPLFVDIFWPSKAWVDYAAQPMIASVVAPEALLPAAAPHLLSRESFIEAYRLVMDPKGVHGKEYDADFGCIYDLMHLKHQPTHDELNTLVQILRKYKVEDPQSDPTEKGNVNQARVDDVVQWLKKKPLIPPQIKVGVASNQVALPQPMLDQPATGNILDFFRMFTFWTMKARSAVVGQNGVATFLKALIDMNNNLKAQALPPVRVHVLGHSFGGKLLAAAVNAIPQPSVATFVILLGAFSQFSFSSDIPGQNGAAGSYVDIVKDGLVANPLVVIYSQYDLANKLYYPLAMMADIGAPVFGLVSPGGEVYPVAAEAIVSNDEYGSIGANGTQGIEAKSQDDLNMQGLDEVYEWDAMNLQGVYCLSVDGGDYIKQGAFPEGAHNDFNHPEIFYLALSMSQR